MSLFGSMTTAISGMNAQSKALGHISDNVANSSTTGYKRVDSTFEDLLTQSTAKIHTPGAVSVTPDATVSLQGTITQSENPLALAISGNGLFSVARPSGTDNAGNIQYDSATPLFTRAGDFTKNAQGYLVNGSGYALEAWPVANGVANTGTLTPVKIDTSAYPPTATTTATLAANLPATPTTNSFSTQMSGYDELGNAKPVTLNWTKSETVDNQWTIEATSGGASLGTAVATFSDGTDATMPAGTLLSLAPADGQTTLTTTGNSGKGSDASITFGGTTPLTLDLGSYGTADGVTQYAGTAYEQRSLVVDGAPAGAYSGVTIRDNGDVVLSYDNGKSSTVARIPVVTFPNPDALQREDGQAFSLTTEAGAMQVSEVGTEGAGTLATSALESSNVDITAEFSKMIVAQRAYTANTRVLTTTDEMLADTINIRR
ncbi:flagellar hook protein FlgE [Roseomonas sp. 18066]|uniref:flagellar hook protein FlgE n=1 Tax=Roseomonas sp. 18066 TaxID=2681412 RepID=UPI0013574040|nr:flagellar hook protein FlgE [Roseomonas sp. 18066]